MNDANTYYLREHDAAQARRESFLDLAAIERADLVLDKLTELDCTDIEDLTSDPDIDSRLVRIALITNERRILTDLDKAELVRICCEIGRSIRVACDDAFGDELVEDRARELEEEDAGRRVRV